MSEIEKIQGNAVARLFNELHEDQIPLTLQLVDSQYSHVIFIDTLRKYKRVPCFLFIVPPGFHQAAEGLDATRIRVEFIGNDKIKHAFQADIVRHARGMLWAHLPQSVDRYQRRRLFRLEAPPGTRLYFNFNNTRYEVLVINVSLGGSLGVLARLTPAMERDLTAYNPQVLENVELVFPAKFGKATVTIKRCQIKRQEKNPQTNKYECALQFDELTEDEQKKLTELFYESQRDFLRKRRFLRG